jgi:flagellar basal-body rod modification protein FlgD
MVRQTFLKQEMTMGVFDIGSMQSAASVVAGSLVPKHRAAESMNTAAVQAKASTSTAATDTDSSNITSSDFLTLLVGELKNQDPTQPTDPNAYITQLVGVNSLQQLIQINQGITTIDNSATAATKATSAV